MPFTFFHLGPALALGLPLRRYIHAPTFILGNVILDLEPLAVLVLRLDYPLHGYLHTLLLATVVGLLLGFVMFKLETPMQPFYRRIQLEPNHALKLKSFLLAGVLGTMLHVVFDAFLYSEMMPFFPSAANPLLTFSVSNLEVYLLCFWLGVFGVGYFVALFVYGLVRKPKKQFAP